MIPAAGHKKILIVDDQPENIHILIENLECEYEILFATSGEKALEIVLSGQRPDLILLDIMMPGMDGYEVCSKLKANTELTDIPVIFVTSQGQEADETTGFHLGAVDYIIKPFRIPVVQARIRAVLRLKEEMNRSKLLASELEDLNKNLEERIRKKTGELEQVHENLKVSEKKYRAIFENAIEGIFQTTPDGKILNASPSLAKILGYESSDQLLAENRNAISLYTRQEDRHQFRYILEHKGEVSGFETQYKKRDGENIWVMVAARAILDNNGNISYFQGFVVDMTESRRARELELANSKLLELDKLKSALMSTASHDLRSPMTAILGYNDLIRIDIDEHLLPYLEDKPELQARTELIMKRLEIIEREGKRLIRLVNDFLDLSRFDSGRSEWHDQPVSVNEIIRQAAKVIRGQLIGRPEVDITVIEDADIPVIICDPDRLMQLLVNLLSNAAKFTAAGGIVVEVSAVAGEYIEVRVVDTGPGISENDKEKIFEKFYRVKAIGITGAGGSQGTGLGLAICKRIVDHYGGKIWVESEVGKGSTFIFRLPFDR